MNAILQLGTMLDGLVLTPTPDAEVADARRFVARHATDAADARQLLEILGIA